VQLTNILKWQLDEIYLALFVQPCIDKNGLLMFKDRLYVPKSVDLKTTILDELHKKLYFGHLGYRKMITNLMKQYIDLTCKMEKYGYLSKCLDC
jgi:hypothetical protein